MESSELVILSTSGKFITKFNVLRGTSLSETLFWTGARGRIPITVIFRSVSFVSRCLRILSVKATFHLTISMCGQRATGKIQRNNYHHGSCGLSFTGKTSSVYLIFTQGTHRIVKNR